MSSPRSLAEDLGSNFQIIGIKQNEYDALPLPASPNGGGVSRFFSQFRKLLLLYLYKSSLLLLHLVGFPGVLDEGSDGHRSDSSWRRGDRAYVVPEILKVSISTGCSIDKSRSDIDNNTIWIHHITSEKSWLPDRNDHDISSSREECEISSMAIGTYDRCSGIDQH